MEGKSERNKEYQREYYLKTRDRRRSKVECALCGRLVCSEYAEKHTKKAICEKYSKKKLK